MLSPDYLKAALERLATDRGTDADRQILLGALRAGQMALITGERAVAIGGTATDAMIITGDGNVVVSFQGADATAIQQALRDPSPGYIRQLPTDLPDFTGRRWEVDELLSLMMQVAKSVAISAVRGMGGVGKTALAIHIAHRLVDHYPDAQIFLDLRGTSEQPLTPVEAMTNVIHSFHPQAPLPYDPIQIERLYRTVLAGKRAVVVLDDAADRDQVRPLLPPAGCALLVTSRSAIALEGMIPISLDQLKPDEARDLLLGIATRVTTEIADQLCHLCGYLPLAIRAAGSLLAVTGDLDPADYARQLSDERTRLERIGKEGINISVEASFNLSYERLEPETARVFHQLAVFPGSFDASAEETICEDMGHRHVSNLVRCGLVLYDNGTKRYRLHDLVRLFASQHLNEDEGFTTAYRHATHYENVARGAEEQIEGGGEGITGALQWFRREWRNIQNGQRWAAAHKEKDNLAAELCNGYGRAGKHMLFVTQPLHECIRWFDMAQVAAHRLGKRDAEGRHLDNLGVAYLALGESDRAMRCFEQALGIFLETDDRQGKGSVLLHVAIGYGALVGFSASIGFLKQSLNIFREREDQRGQGAALTQLGRAYFALKEFPFALKFSEQALDVYRGIGYRGGEGGALVLLGRIDEEIGRTEQAILRLEQAMCVFKDIGDHKSEADTLFELGMIYDRWMRTGKAGQCFERAKLLYLEVGFDLPTKYKAQLWLRETLRPLWPVIAFLFAVFRQFARRFIPRLGTHLSQVNEVLGANSRLLDQPQRLIGSCEHLLAIFRLVKDTTGEADVLWTMSHVLHHLGDRPKAIDYGEAALKIYQGMEHPNAAQVRKQLVEWRRKIGQEC